MTRIEFFDELRFELSGLPQSEIGRIAEYYDEIFNEALDEGKTEQEICDILDTPEDIAGRVRAEIAFVRAEQEPSAKSMSTLLVVLLSIFALPIGLPIAIAVFAVILSLVITVFAVVVSLGATMIGLFAGGIIGLVYGIVMIISGSFLYGLSLVGASIALIGIGALGGFGVYALCKVLFRGIAKCCRGLYNWVQSRGIKGGR